MKKALCLLLTLLMVASLVACGGPNSEVPSGSSTSGSTGEKKVKDRIVFSTRLDFTTMDVTNTPSTISKSVYHAVYNTLVASL